MKKSGILNAPLSKVVAGLGHTDRLVVCDCGLPIPKDCEVIDLALTKNIPHFVDTLKIILEEFAVEKAIIAEEIKSKNSEVLSSIKNLLPDTSIDEVSHEDFKNLTRENVHTVFVRTGEASPYANIILVGGVTF